MKQLFTMVCLLCSMCASAYDFKVDGIYYDIISENGKTCEVTYKEKHTCEGPDDVWYENDYSGDIDIPEKVTYDGTVYTVTGIGAHTFDHGGCTSLKIPRSVINFGELAIEGARFGEIIVDNENPVYTSVDGVLYTKDMSVLLKCSTNKAGSFDIPNTVTRIVSNSFDGCEGLTSVNIPNSVSSIEDYTFHNCEGLTSVNIPNSVTSIGGYAFLLCI